MYFYKLLRFSNGIFQTFSIEGQNGPIARLRAVQSNRIERRTAFWSNFVCCEKDEGQKKKKRFLTALGWEYAVRSRGLPR